ncbi:methyl-accepting chemotaxis protein [Treponema sp.]|uniref:methyl-accepting chemotaxis protein n=1 Tax=Treponema sp. TaxID=166 RepID=UPI00388ED229
MDLLNAKNKIKRLPFPVIAAIFSLVIAVILSVSFLFISKSARINFEKSSHKELSQLAKNMKLEFELGLNEQLALAMQMAKSPVIIRYFEKPSDSSLKKEAFEEVLAYQNSFLSRLSFMINDNDLRYYANNEYLYTLDKSNSSSAWYTSLLDTDKAYVFNVDYDIGLKQTFMWVNCIVRNQNNKFLGLIGTGIPISQFVNSLYSQLPENYSMFLFNEALETTGSTDLHHLEKKSRITDVITDLREYEGSLYQIGQSFIDTENTVYAFQPLEEIGWNILVSKDYTVRAFLENAIVPASICLIVIVFVFLGFFVFLRVQLLHLNDKKVGTSILEEIQNLADSAKNNTETAQNQSASVKEIVATMEDNNSLSEDISEKIKDVSQIAVKTSGDVADGVSYLEKNVQQLHEIAQANLNTISGIKALGDKIENIWDIVTLINNVADQAKIIAFNAELEASSAGEAGRNFHIVATEIRRLADGIIDGTKEIKERITEIQKSSDNLILFSENGTEKINEGVENAKGLEERFESIKNSAQSTANSSSDITTIIQQQAVASEQMLATLKQIASGVENFSSATADISRASEKLKNIAEDLSR